MLLHNVIDDAMDVFEGRKNADRFFNDPEAWADYMLGIKLWSKQAEVARAVVTDKSVVVKASHGVGKLVSADTPLPTPNGWVKAGDVRQGDILFDERGEPTTVTGLSPVWNRPAYRITFDDGTSIVAGAEHEWNVLDEAEGGWDETHTYETQELYEMGTQNRWRIPLPKPLQLPEQDLPIDPYLQGRNSLSDSHIPAQYLRASESQRRALLAGLMDAGGDGTSIHLQSASLARDVLELVRTLGRKPFSTTDGVRHQVSWEDSHTQRAIVSIVPEGTTENFCIEVDSPRHLYLAGEQMVPTHNSYLAAILICWWVDTRYPKAFVASTAPSQKQISAIVWRYVRQLKSLADQRYKDRLIDHPFPGYITSDNEWKEDGGVILGFGRKPPDNKEDDSFQGIHDAYVLAIGDEAVGLSPAMIDALGNITSNEQSRRVLICNPTNPASYVGKIYKENYPNWTKFTISCFDSPNFTGGEGLDEDALEKLVGPSYVEEKKAEYGEDSARYKARVLGEFAWDTGASLITPEDAAIGFDTDIVPDVDAEIILGVDIARFGEDDSVIYMNHGGVLRYVDKSPSAKMRVTATANWIHKHAIDAGAHEVRVDGAGIGGAVVDEILSFEPRYRVVEMNPSATTPDRKQWHNARSYWWDKFRRALREGQIDLDNADERLVDELLMVEYKFNDATGGLVMQSKEDMKKKGRKSPDFADAAVMACAPLYEVPQAVHGKIYTDPSAYTMADFQLDLPNYIRAWTETW